MATSPCSTPITGTAAGPATALSAEVTRARTCTFFFTAVHVRVLDGKHAGLN